MTRLLAGSAIDPVAEIVCIVLDAHRDIRPIEVSVDVLVMRSGLSKVSDSTSLSKIEPS